MLRIGTTNFTPRMDLYGPNGALISSAFVNTSFNHDVMLSLQATNSGTFTVVVSSQFYDNVASAAGTYGLTLAQVPEAFVVSPGDQGGPLVNGAANAGDIYRGDLDMWSFTASAGDTIVLRMGTTNFTPLINLYGPNGALIGSAFVNTSFNHDVMLSVQATNSATFTVVVSSQFYDNVAGPAGTYGLTLAQVPEAFVVSAGDQGGPLTNGAANAGAISLGELDMWSFTANAGDNLVLRMGTTNFTPLINLYGPNGALIGSAFVNSSFNHAATLSVQATNSGTFTVVVSSLYYDNAAGAAGTYGLTLARVPGAFVVSPGDQGGMLVGGVSEDGVIDLGDIDMWRFAGCRGQLLTLTCAKLSGTSFSPRIRLYGRTGALLATAINASTAVLNFAATNSGLYTALVDGGNPNDAGTYQLSGNGLSDAVNLCLPIISGTNLDLAGFGGTSNATFILFMTTNLATPAALWTPILTNQFDQFGEFDHTNLYNPTLREQFFRLEQL